MRSRPICTFVIQSSFSAFGESLLPGGSRSLLSFAKLTNGFGMRHRLTGIGLTDPFFNLCQETEPFDRVLKRGTFRKLFDNLQDLLLDHISSHLKPPATRTLRHFTLGVNFP